MLNLASRDTMPAHAGSGWDPSDPLRAYPHPMGRVALLTRQEEIELARRMEQGEGIVLVARALRAGERMAQRAKARLVEANLRLVEAIARRYRGRGLSLLDLIQEENRGLSKAVDPGWQGARATAAPGQTPGVGGSWSPPPSYGPAQMK
jgi:RNA polymerase primary sigma factor